MRTEKWQMYIDTLQGHPSICQSNSDSLLGSIMPMVGHIPPSKFPRLLDIGAGEGLETAILHGLGYDATGIINGKINLEYAHKNFSDIKFVEADMHDLPFASESFDCIYMNHTFEHTFAPYIFLLEMFCVLKEGGRIWIAMPSFKEMDNPSIGDDSKISQHHPNMICYNILRQIFESTGFKIIYNTKIDTIPYYDNPYILERQNISLVHSDVKTAILKRKDIFG